LCLAFAQPHEMLGVVSMSGSSPEAEVRSIQHPGRWIYAFVILLPVLAWVIDVAYYLLLNQRIDHLMQNLNKTAIVQCLVLAVTAVATYRKSGQKVVVIIFIIGCLIANLFLFLWVQGMKDKATSKVVRRAIYRVELVPNTLTHKQLLDLAEVMIDEDYLPYSYANMISQYYRKERREVFCSIVNSVSKSAVLKETDLIVPESDRKLMNIIYIFLCLGSGVLCLGYLGLQIHYYHVLNK